MMDIEITRSFETRSAMNWRTTSLAIMTAISGTCASLLRRRSGRQTGGMEGRRSAMKSFTLQRREKGAGGMWMAEGGQEGNLCWEEMVGNQGRRHRC